MSFDWPRTESAEPTAHLRWRNGTLEQRWTINSLIMTLSGAPDIWAVESTREEWRPIREAGEGQ